VLKVELHPDRLETRIVTRGRMKWVVTYRALITDMTTTEMRSSLR
jgi:hypothetical protein